MAKTYKVKTEPKTLNETTFETNIVSEIASIFNSPFNFGYPFRLRWLFEIDRININAFRKRKTKLYRLTPREENTGGGWDTKVSIPKGNGQNRGIFIQFKSGEHKISNNITDSLFNKQLKNPNPHAEFSFNDNSNNNQHQTLKNLADHLSSNGISPKCVMYGFPRITQMEDFEKLNEDLLLHTSFLTIDEMDNEANKANVNLYNGKTHHFRTCYRENKREISSDIFRLTNSSESENVLYEIFLVKIAHLKNQFRVNHPSDSNYINIELLFSLAEYLKVSPSYLENLSDYYPSGRKNISNYFTQLINYRNDNFYKLFNNEFQEFDSFEWRNRLFRKIAEYLNDKKDSKIDIQNDIPANYTFNLNSKKY